MNLVQFSNQAEHQEIRDWIACNLTNYLEGDRSRLTVGQIEHMVDYLNARAKQCENRKKSFNLRKMSVDQAFKLAEKWTRTLKKKGRDIVETESDLEVVHDYGNGVRLVKLLSKSSYLKEGNMMSHCVGSYFGKNGSDVYSLRDGKNMPHCTFEVSKDSVQQIKGKGNGSIHPKYIKYVLKALEVLGKDLRESEMTYLGYRKINDEVFKFYNNRLKNFKWMDFKGKLYLYEYQDFLFK